MKSSRALYLDRPRLPHKTRPPLSGRVPLYLVMRVRRELWKLRKPSWFAALRRAFWAGCNRFGFKLIHFGVEHSYVQLVAEAEDKEALSRGMQGLAVRMARALNRVLHRRGTVFADRYYATAIETLGAMRAILNIVVQAFRRAPRLPPEPFTSAAGPVERPRTWLLRFVPP